MSLQSIAQPDIAKVHAMLSKMDGPQLQQFAAANQDNAIYVSLAMQVDKDRKADMQRLQALMTGREQPKVIPQAVAALNPQGMIPPGMGGQGGAPMPPPGGPQGPMPPQGMPMGMPPPGMQMPPAMPPAPQMPPPSGPNAAPQGLAGLPAQNIQNMADGGIAGYADEDEAVGYADGGAIRMAGGGLDEDAIRAQARSLGYPPELTESLIQQRRAAENAPPQRNLAYTPATPSAVGVPNISMTRDPGYDPWKNPPTINQLYVDQPPMYDYLMGGDSANAQEKAQRAKDRLAMGSGLGKAYAAAKDVLTLPGRGVAGAFETAITRPLRAAGVPVPYLPESFYGGDRSSMTPYMDEIRRQEQKAAASGQLPLPADVKPAQPVVKPAGEEAAAAAPAAPTQSYADLYKAVGAGNVPAASRGAGLASLVRAGGPPTLTPPDALTPEKAMENVGQFFDPKDLYAQADRVKAEALGRAEETAQFVKLNKPAAPFKKLAEKLDTEEFNEVSEKEKAKGMALMMAGLKMMESPYGGKGLGSFLRNVGAGATEGAKELQKSNKEFKELAQKRMQMRVTIEAAQDAAARGDFDREIALRTRADQIEDSANNNRMRIGEALFNAKGTAALTAFNHAENVANQFKLTEFGAKTDVYTNERRIAAQAANTQAQIRANVDAEIRKAAMPSETIRTAGILGGAPYGVLPTPEQVQNGLKVLSEKTDMGKLYVQSKAEFDAKNMNPQKQFMSPQEFLALYGTVNSFRSNPAPTNTPTGQIFK
jgi:hypothetical protein